MHRDRESQRWCMTRCFTLFYIDIFKDKTITGYTVKLVFKITQHSRDEQIIQSFITYFECGGVYQKGGCAKDLKVTKLSDIVDKIIPFFQQHKIKGVKHKDFEDFCKVVEMMKEKKTFNSGRIRANPQNKKRNEPRKEVRLVSIFICMKNLNALFFYINPAKAFWENAKWVQLSNSGNTWKFLIPNYNRKVINGWINYSCKVIIQLICLSSKRIPEKQ